MKNIICLYDYDEERDNMIIYIEQEKWEYKKNGAHILKENDYSIYLRDDIIITIGILNFKNKTTNDIINDINFIINYYSLKYNKKVTTKSIIEYINN